MAHKFTDDERSRGGKASGTARLRTFALTEFLSQYINADPEDFDKLSMARDFSTLNEKDRLAFLMSYMPYEKPKLSSEERKEERTIIVMSEEDKAGKLKELKEILNKTG